ncbi:MAG: hypothetical protein ACK54F_05990 [Planctomycetia bacterium]|jgi:hypothetical protein
MPTRPLLLMIVAVLMPAASGCASLGKPDWLEPGPAAYQRRKAVRFDPYLQDDIAPSSLRLPLMDGARPRDFAEPVPEVRRARWWSPMR